MRQPRVWFLIAICVLLPWHIAMVARDPWFGLPPKPVGDGPDYENIAYHLASGEGWALDWTDPRWRAPYLSADSQVSATAAATAAATVPAIVPAENDSEHSRDQTSAARRGYAVQLARSDGLAPTTARPPLFPAIVAFIYWIVERGGTAFACVRLFLAACLAFAGAIATALSAKIVGSITPKAWPVGIAAGATLGLAVLDRTVRTYATDFLTEPLALLLVQAWLWCVCELLGVFGTHRNQHADANFSSRLRALANLAGVLLALLIYTRSLVVLWLPGVWLLLWAASRFKAATPDPSDSVEPRDGKPAGARSFALATRVIIVCLVVCAPWWIRNCIVLRGWMPLGTQGPITLVGGYSGEALAHNGEWQIEPELRLRQQVEDDSVVYLDRSIPQREVRIARLASREVRQWASQHAAQLPRLAVMRVINEWNPYTGRALAWKLMALTGLCWLALVAPRAALVLGGLLVLNTLCVMVLYSVGGRFLVPLYGILYTLAGLGITSLALALHRFSVPSLPSSRSPR